jgi:hypothetical protein
VKSLVASFMLSSSVVMAQEVPINPACLTEKQLTDNLFGDFREMPFFYGQSSEKTSVMVWLNETTHSWTIVQRNHEDGCFIILFNGEAGDLLGETA